MSIFLTIEETFGIYEEKRKHFASKCEFCGNECHINFKIWLFCYKMTTLNVKQTQQKSSVLSSKPLFSLYNKMTWIITIVQTEEMKQHEYNRNLSQGYCHYQLKGNWQLLLNLLLIFHISSTI